MTITTKRGLELEIPEAEIFCELKSTDQKEREEQRKVAFRLFEHYMDIHNHDKAVKYAILATGGKPADLFKFNASDAFNWYNVLRVFVGSINRLFTFFKAAFLPIWYPITGLFYGIQALVAKKEGNKDNTFYWSAWLLFNGFGALVLFGVLAASGIGLPIATLAIGLYSFVFDVKWDVYKYATERGQHEKLLSKLNEDILKSLENRLDKATLDNLKDKSNKEILFIVKNKLDLVNKTDAKLYDQLQNKLKNDPHKKLRGSLIKDIKKMKGDRIEAGAIDTTILIGGFLFLLTLSSFLPPVTAVIGASFIFGAFSYLVAKKTYNSWTSPTGFLNHYVRQPLTNLLTRCASLVKNALQKLPEPSVASSPIVMQHVRPDLHISIPPNNNLTRPLLLEAESPAFSSTTNIESKIAVETKAVSQPLSPDIIQKLNDAKNIVEGFVKLTPQDRKNVKEVLTKEMGMDWNQVLQVYIQKYKSQKQGEFYTCSMKQTIKTCLNHFQSFLVDEKKKVELDIVAIQKLETEIRFLKAREGKCTGEKSNDLGLIAVDKSVFESKATDFDYANQFHLLKLLGIDSYEKYQTQVSHWEKYYNDTKRINSPFFDRSLPCGFEAERVDNAPFTPSITVST